MGSRMKQGRPLGETRRFPNIDKWIASHGMTQREFSRLSGVPDVSYILRGKNEPGYHNIRLILDATGMTFEEAFREAGKG